MISKRIAVIDIGKTNAKFAIVDTKDFDEIAVFTMPNKVRQGPYYPFFYVAAIWTFLLDKLKYTQAKFGIDAVSVTGGHLGAGLGVVELTIALHYVFNTPKDKLVWDVSHQCYPHKIITGRKK